MKEQPVIAQYELKIASLNYSGVLTSPYQFYDKQDEKQLLISQTFTSFVKQKYPQFAQGKGENFKWNMQSLDLRWKIRYSPTSVFDVGIKKQTNTMMNEEQFNREWYRTHEESKQEIRKYYQKTYKTEQVEQKMELQVQRCRQFDLFCYKTLMKVYCGIDDINKMGNLDSKTYLQKKMEDFSKPYLCQKQKIKSTKNSFHKLNFDVYFVQQANQSFKDGVQDMSNYHLIKKQLNGSIILIKKKICPNHYNFEEANKKFFNIYSQILTKKHNKLITSQQIQKRFNFNNDSIFQILQNIILINVHLSSKKEKNAIQLNQVLQEVKDLVQNFQDYEIIVGGDFNSNVDRVLFTYLKKFKIPVMAKKRFSVKKKRSMMQPQRHKAHHLDEMEKDYIFSTFQTLKQEVNLIDGTNIDEFYDQLPLLPRTEHPYDHYLVTSVFRMAKNIIY